MRSYVYTDLIPNAIPTRNGYRVIATTGWPAEETTVAYFLVAGSTVDTEGKPAVRDFRCWELAQEAANTHATNIAAALAIPAVP